MMQKLSVKSGKDNYPSSFVHVKNHFAGADVKVCSSLEKRKSVANDELKY